MDYQSITLDDRFLSDDLKEAARTTVPRAAENLALIQSGRCQGSEWLGWYDWPRRAGPDLVKELDSLNPASLPFFDAVVVCGIGGSYGGSYAAHKALSHAHPDASPERGKRPIVFTGCDLSEADLIELLDYLDGRQPIINVISKAGTTTEPSVAFSVLSRYLEKRFGVEDARRRTVVTTGTSGALRGMAEEQQLRSFVVPEDVGGRFSVLTAVGLVPLSLAGHDVKAMLAGAGALFSELNSLQPTQPHPVLSYAATRLAAYEAGSKIDVMAYMEPRLGGIAEWWKQLFAESEGKDGKALFPVSVCYSRDLHSLGQIIQEGERHLFETFLEIEAPFCRDSRGVARRLEVPPATTEDGIRYLSGQTISEINRAAMAGTRAAHFDGGVSSLKLTVPRLDEFYLGMLFAFFQSACGVSAALLGVNPYNQPGVEAYKHNLFTLLGKPGFEQNRASLRERVGLR